MNMDNISRYLTLAANLCVVAGIFFLVVEIRDNNTMARVSSTLDAAEGQSNVFLWLASDTARTVVYMKGLADYQGLAPVEQEQFDLVMRAYLFTASARINAVNYQLVGVDGAMNPDARPEIDIYRLMNQPGFLQWWAAADKRGLPGLVAGIIEERLQAHPR